MAEKSAISLMAILVLFLVFHNSKLPSIKPFSLLLQLDQINCGCKYDEGGQPLWLLGGCCSPSVQSLMSSAGFKKKSTVLRSCAQYATENCDWSFCMRSGQFIECYRANET
jgi:hypothetical protein